jgi:MFS family permease
VRRLHHAWVVAGVAFLALVGAAAFRAAPGPLMVPLHDELGWSMVTMSAAVSVNLVLYGLTAPFAAALMQRFGLRRVTTVALLLVAAGSGLSVFVRAAWQLTLTWGVLVGLGTGSMALVFAATVANAWFVKRRGLVLGILTAGGAGSTVSDPYGGRPRSDGRSRSTSAASGSTASAAAATTRDATCQPTAPAR